MEYANDIEFALKSGQEPDDQVKALTTQTATLSLNQIEQSNQGFNQNYGQSGSQNFNQNNARYQSRGRGQRGGRRGGNRNFNPRTEP